MRTLLLGLTLFLTLNLSAQEKTDGPAIEFTSQVVDYGEIERGSDGIRALNSPTREIGHWSSLKCILLVDAPSQKNQKHPSLLAKKERFKSNMIPIALVQFAKPLRSIPMRKAPLLSP